jgi:hypothetical protein
MRLPMLLFDRRSLEPRKSMGPRGELKGPRGEPFCGNGSVKNGAARRISCAAGRWPD